MNDLKGHLWVTILAGGGGTRLWPLSRDKNPKQFIKLFGDKTLLQITADRLSKITSWKKMLIVTTSPLYAKEIIKELPDLPKENILVEPTRRGTAIAHGLAAVYILKQDPDAVILNESADHVVSPSKNYIETFLIAARAACETRSLVAIGIKPGYPHVGMGHIKIGKMKNRIKHRPVYKVDRFVEKPPFHLAKQFTESGDYYWNGNLYVWRADSILKSIRKHARKIGRGLEAISESIGTENERMTITRIYKNMPTISIDYAVSEREKDFLMIVADFSWNDVGDWKEVWSLTKKDGEGNAVIHLNGKGEWVGVETENSLVQTDKLLIATIGVKDLIIVETDDAVLIANKSEAEKVKEMVNKLKEEKREKFL